MADLFDEVEEQLRSDRYRTLALKALPWVIALLAAVLVGALAYWGWDSYRQQTTTKAAEQYVAAMEAFNAGREDDAARLWGETAKSPARGYKSLALMQLGGLKIAKGKTDEGVKLFDEAAAAAPNEIIGDTARLKSAFALLDTSPYKDVEARLTPLLEDGRPYRVQAREALAFAKLMAGNAAGARSDFSIITAMLDAPEGARARARAAAQLIDAGSTKALPAAVKAAAALPPSAPVAPGPQVPDQLQTQAPGPQ